MKIPPIFCLWAALVNVLCSFLRTPWTPILLALAAFNITIYLAFRDYEGPKKGDR